MMRAFSAKRIAAWAAFTAIGVLGLVFVSSPGRADDDSRRRLAAFRRRTRASISRSFLAEWSLPVGSCPQSLVRELFPAAQHKRRRKVLPDDGRCLDAPKMHLELFMEAARRGQPCRMRVRKRNELAVVRE